MPVGLGPVAFHRPTDLFLAIITDNSISEYEYERSKLAVWDYPVSDKYTKIWQKMKDTVWPGSMEEALIKSIKMPVELGPAAFHRPTDLRLGFLSEGSKGISRKLDIG